MASCGAPRRPGAQGARLVLPTAEDAIRIGPPPPRPPRLPRPSLRPSRSSAPPHTPAGAVDLRRARRGARAAARRVRAAARGAPGAGAARRRGGEPAARAAERAGARSSRVSSRVSWSGHSTWAQHVGAAHGTAHGAAHGAAALLLFSLLLCSALTMQGSPYARLSLCKALPMQGSHYARLPQGATECLLRSAYSRDCALRAGAHHGARTATRGGARARGGAPWPVD